MKWVNKGEKAMLVASMMVSRLINAFRNPALINYSTILCIKTDEIGDMCYSTHVFQMLRRQYPDAEIDVFCKPFNKDLLQADPSLNKIYTSAKELKSRYDLIIDLRCTWQSIFYALRVWPAARLDRGTIRFRDYFLKKYPHELITNADVVFPVISPKHRTLEPVLFSSEADQLNASAFIHRNQLSRFALLHISSRMKLKEWPAARYCQLAEMLHSKYDLQIVFIGDQSEVAAIDAARSRLLFTAYSTAGELSLGALAALMKQADLYVGNDSGPLHMAAIQGVSALGLYGPGPGEIFYPVGKKATYIHKILECNPCDQVHCVHPENTCMQRITFTEVEEKVKEMLQEG